MEDRTTSSRLDKITNEFTMSFSLEMKTFSSSTLLFLL